MHALLGLQGEVMQKCARERINSEIIYKQDLIKVVISALQVLKNQTRNHCSEEALHCRLVVTLRKAFAGVK